MFSKCFHKKVVSKKSSRLQKSSRRRILKLESLRKKLLVSYLLPLCMWKSWRSGRRWRCLLLKTSGCLTFSSSMLPGNIQCKTTPQGNGINSKLLSGEFVTRNPRGFLNSWFENYVLIHFLLKNLSKKKENKNRGSIGELQR